MKTPSPTYLTTLTPLRGIAALLLVIFHANLMIAPFVDPTQTRFIENGWLWVDFFFVLSGFVLSHSYGDGFHQSFTWAQYKRYMGARLARVYPLHFVTLLVAAALALEIQANAIGLSDFFKTIFGLHTIPASFLFLQSVHLFGTPPLNTPSWSLSTEWWVYVLFPFLAGPFSRLTGLGKGIVFLGITALYLGLMEYVAPHWGNRMMVKPGELAQATINLTADFGYFRCLAGFLLGMLTYTLYRSKWALGLLQPGWLFLLLVFSVGIAMHRGIHELLIIALFPLLILTAAYNTDFIKRTLETRPLQRLGDWSFSIYMVHVPLIFIFYRLILPDYPNLFISFETFFRSQRAYAPTLFDGGVCCLGLIASTLLVASLTYRFVEIPARKYINNQFDHQSRTDTVDHAFPKATK